MHTQGHDSLLGPGLRSRFSADELRARFLATELAVVDIDECLYPGFSQSDLGHVIFFAIAARPRAAADLLLLPQLVSGGAYVRRVQLLRRLGRRPTNAALMRRYEQAMLGIPEEYFLAGVRTIPPRSFAWALQTLRLLGQRTPVGLISLGIHLIAEEYRRQLNMGGPSFVVSADANTISFEPDDRGRRVFAGYRPPLRTGPGHKLQVLKQRLEQRGACVPLVIGNGKDEAEMAALARERGGLSIGFCPGREDAPCFDVVLRARSWGPLHDLLAGLLQQPVPPGGGSPGSWG